MPDEKKHPGGWDKRPSIVQEVLTWHPAGGGDPVEIPLNEFCHFGGFPGKFRLSHRPIPADEAERIADAVSKSLQNPGKTFEVGQ